MSNPVIFIVPITGFNLDKRPPADGENTTENITVTGTDYTKIVVPAGVKYNSNPSTNYQITFTGPTDDSKRFTVIFPPNTKDVTNNDPAALSGGKYSKIFMSPSKIYYKFGQISSYNDTIVDTSTVIATNGPIDIVTTSSENSKVESKNVESYDKELKAKITEAGEEVSNNLEKVIYENFNSKFLNLIYTVIKDFLVIIIIWIIILSIGVWGTVDKDFVYPIDVTKYPYTYNDGESINNLTSFIPTDSGVFCGKLDTSSISKISTYLADKLQKDPELRDKLHFINPTMSEISQKNIYYTSKKMQSSCSKTGSYSDALSVFIYWFIYLIFTQVVYQSYILNGFHSLLNTIVGTASSIFSSENYAASIALALLIYGIMSAVQPTIDMMKKLILNKNNFDKTVIEKPENAFIYGGISALSIVIFIAIPLFLILFLVGLVGHIQSILRIIFEANSVECAFLSVVALTASIASFFQVLHYIISRLSSGSGIISINTIEEQFMKYLKFSSIYKVISNGAGVGIPLILALSTAFIISFRILFTSVFLLKKKVELLKNLSPAIMILLFYYLFFNVNRILGPTQSYITIAVIAFFGFYFLTKK
jgi:hypothetical protein